MRLKFFVAESLKRIKTKIWRIRIRIFWRFRCREEVIPLKTRKKNNHYFRRTSAHWCGLAISVPLGVGQAPVENSRRSYKIKKCRPEKVSIIWHLQIDTLPTQKLEFIKMGIENKIQILFKTWSGKGGFLAIFNFLLISQLIQKFLQSNFSKLVFNMHIYLYENSKILFLVENLGQNFKLFFLSNAQK